MVRALRNFSAKKPAAGNHNCKELFRILCASSCLLLISKHCLEQVSLIQSEYLINNLHPVKLPYAQINDVTIQLSNVSRPWLDAPFGRSQSQPPPAKILLTDYGWNHPDPVHGLKHFRTIRQRELLQAIVDHEWFDPRIDWNQIVDGTTKLDPRTRYYVFLDVETCFESNYPVYAGENADRTGSRRVATDKTKETCYNLNTCTYVQDALDVLNRQSPTVQAILIVMECRGQGPPVNYRRNHPYDNLALVSLSASTNQLTGRFDQGLPPPAITPIQLTETQKKSLCSHDDRPYLLSFVGNTRIRKKYKSPRKRLVRLLQQEPDMLVMDRVEFQQQIPNRTVANVSTQSVFSAAPRGDNLFSYRFTELLSAGAIPVVYTNAGDWALAFRRELVHWDDCVVRISEHFVHETASILRNISKREQCARQQACYSIYERYMANATGTIKGIIDGLELAITTTAF
jgi:hypothetical protein